MRELSSSPRDLRRLVAAEPRVARPSLPPVLLPALRSPGAGTVLTLAFGLQDSRSLREIDQWRPPDGRALALAALGLLCPSNRSASWFSGPGGVPRSPPLGGLLLIAAAVAWPAPLIRTSARTALLDQYLPACSSPSTTRSGARSTSMAYRRCARSPPEIPSSSAHMARSPASPDRAPGIDPQFSAGRPIRDVAAAGGFFVLARPGARSSLGHPDPAPGLRSRRPR